MNGKKLLYLVVAAVLLTALAYWSARRQHAAPPAAIGKHVLPALDINAVARVEILKDGRTVTLVRGDEGWSVAKLFGFPADVSKLRASLIKLQDLRIGDVARGMSFGSNDVTLVDLQDGSGKSLAALRLGERYKRGGPAAETEMYRPAEGRYVSPGGHAGVYLVKETFDEFDGESKAWTEAQILSIPSADIQAIELSSPTGQTVRLTRDTGTLQLEGLATNEEFDTSRSYGLESAFGYLNFDGVADPRLDDSVTGLAQPHFYRVTLKHGDRYAAAIGRVATNSTERYVRFETQFADPGTNATRKVEQEKRRAELAPRLKWTYLISSFTTENMTRNRAELVKPKVVATNEVSAAATVTNAPAAVTNAPAAP